MSSSRTNGLTKDYSGKFGDQYVLRRKNGKSLMTKLPEKTKLPMTEAQKRVKANFRAAVAYAREKLSDQVMRAAYLKKGNGVRTAYNVACLIFFQPAGDQPDQCKFLQWACRRCHPGRSR